MLVRAEKGERSGKGERVRGRTVGGRQADGTRAGNGVALLVGAGVGGVAAFGE